MQSIVASRERPQQSATSAMFGHAHSKDVDRAHPRNLFPFSDDIDRFVEQKAEKCGAKGRRVDDSYFCRWKLKIWFHPC